VRATSGPQAVRIRPIRHFGAACGVSLRGQSIRQATPAVALPAEQWAKGVHRVVRAAAARRCTKRAFTRVRQGNSRNAPRLQPLSAKLGHSRRHGLRNSPAVCGPTPASVHHTNGGFPLKALNFQCRELGIAVTTAGISGLDCQSRWRSMNCVLAHQRIDEHLHFQFRPTPVPESRLLFLVACVGQVHGERERILVREFVTCFPL